MTEKKTKRVKYDRKRSSHEAAKIYIVKMVKKEGPLSSTDLTRMCTRKIRPEVARQYYVANYAAQVRVGRFKTPLEEKEVGRDEIHRGRQIIVNHLLDSLTKKKILKKAGKDEEGKNTWVVA